MHNGIDIDTLLDQAKPLQQPVPICLRGDLVSEVERLNEELATVLQAEADARVSGAASLDTGSQGRQIAEQIEALREQMKASTITFMLRALPKQRFRAMIDEHPPRKDDDGGVLALDDMGVNSSTFFDVLIRECTAEPQLTEPQWQKLFGKLSDRQFQVLSTTAWAVNRSDVDVPFSRAASKLLKGSGTE